MKTLWNPLTWFVALLLIIAVRNFSLFELNAPPSKESEVLAAILFSFIAACWVSRDSQKKGDSWPADHIMSFCVVLFPAYVLTTRKWKGAALLLGLVTAVILTGVLPEILA